MDLTFTPEQQTFRRELQEWFTEHGPKGRLDSPYSEPGYSQHLEWEHALHEAGWAAPSWPAEVGGQGVDAWAELIYDEEYARFRLPERLNKMGLIHGGPTVMAHGTEQQKSEWLPGILTCEDIWCQGFSEPGAGSDLAAVRTTGRIKGDAMIVDGQKIWTSQGIIATTMFALVRTDQESRGHRGLTFVIIDLRSPGVEIRPLGQLHGNPGFAEVFFSGVEVPVANVIGEVGDGWHVASTSLALERGTARGSHTRMEQALVDLARDTAATGASGASVRRLGELAAWVAAYEQAAYASTHEIATGRGKDYASVIKMLGTQILTAVHEENLEVLGADAEVMADHGPNAEMYGMRRNYWHGRGAEIYAGSNEIQRNIIAERQLGLPKEPRG
ncbi:MAG: acyl-CoA dehydrogenase family protein [Aeromicrobium sp.]|uniref:acyl-CoA dehydrogenase family protein n=1 Tax=Aeromicrobium sp. TaxID=1871063 RepID=UPI00260763B8|nr:acyl-CoA dehydrogenase family protein [Aeromicrobium sp.]MDF1703555.1 acyl-CoA dehydrogenase family protein [Aeromicrobium sp.]